MLFGLISGEYNRNKKLFSVILVLVKLKGRKVVHSVYIIYLMTCEVNAKRFGDNCTYCNVFAHLCVVFKQKSQYLAWDDSVDVSRSIWFRTQVERCRDCYFLMKCVEIGVIMTVMYSAVNRSGYYWNI